MAAARERRQTSSDTRRDAQGDSQRFIQPQEFMPDTAFVVSGTSCARAGVTPAMGF